jgi:hypothetical protein
VLLAVGVPAKPANVADTPAGVFGRIVPFLVAFAAVALLVQPRVSAWLEEQGSRLGPSLTRRIPARVLRIVVALVGLGLAADLWLHSG